MVFVNLNSIIQPLKTTFEHVNHENLNAMDGRSSFSRDSVLTFRNLIILLLQQLQRSHKRELLDFVISIQENGANLTSISAAAF
jgi:hypothetical protein